MRMMLMFLLLVTPAPYTAAAFVHNHVNGHETSVFISFAFWKTRCPHSTLQYSSSQYHDNSDNSTPNNHNEQQEIYGIRLNKVFKATHSRRQADALIDEGRVSVNGSTVQEKGGFKVIPFQDMVALDGVVVEGWEAMKGILLNEAFSSNPKPTSEHARSSLKTTQQSTPVTTTRTPQKNSNSNSNKKRHFEYVKYWKPRGITCTTDRSIPSNIIDDLIHQRGYRPTHRVYPVGRLDKDTSGLILLTSDGRLPNAALRGQFKQPKVYEVLVDQPLTHADLEELRQGVVITTVAQRDRQRKPLTARTLPCRVQRLPRTFGKGVTMTLVEGRNRQIRKMINAIGRKVVELHRCQFMGLTVEPLQRAGEWIPLDDDELAVVDAVLQRAADVDTIQYNATVSQ